MTEIITELNKTALALALYEEALLRAKAEDPALAPGIDRALELLDRIREEDATCST